MMTVLLADLLVGLLADLLVEIFMNNADLLVEMFMNNVDLLKKFVIIVRKGVLYQDKFFRLLRRV
jgi:hypothetical protein